MADAPAPPTGPDDPLTKMMLGLQDPSPAGPSPDSPAPTGPPPGGEPGHGPSASDAPPPAPVGPPKLRGQAMSPAPPQPGAPPEDLSLPTVLAGAKKNFARSAMGNIASTVEAFNPLNIGRDLSGLWNLGQGALSQAGIIDQGDPKAQAQHQAGLNALENMNWEHYGTVDNFLRTVRDDPTTPIADAAAVASLLSGGEGIAARVPGAIEKGLLAAASRAPSAMTRDALLNAAVTGGQVARGVNRVMTPVRKVAGVAQYADPTAAALTLARKAPGVISKIPGIRTATEIAGAAGGSAVGAALQGILPIPGAGIIGGGILGDKIAKGAMKLAGNPKVRRVVSGVVDATARAAPVVGAVGRTQPMTPAEQGMQSGIQQAFGGPGGGQGGPGAPAAPGGQPGAPPPSTDPDDATLAQMAHDFGLGPAPAAAAAIPSSGLQGAPPGGTPMSAPRGAQYGRIGDIATNAGASPTEVATLQHIARVESGGNPNAVSPSGRYHGAFQYLTSGGLEADTVRALGDLKNNARRLLGMGVAPDAGALYVMHQQGPGGGPALLSAPPGTRAIDALAPAYKGNVALARQAIAHNLGINYKTPEGAAQANAAAESMSAADFVNLWRRKLGSVAAQNGGRIGFAEGGNVVDMTEALMRRAEAHHKATQQDTKPLLSVPDETIAKALKVAQAGI